MSGYLNSDYVAAISTVVVGFLAYVVYELGKVSQSADAAKLLVLDIRNAEGALQALRSGFSPQAWTKVVMVENNWEKYKQLFVSVLNTDEFRNVDDFFHNWSHLVMGRNEIDAFNHSQLAAKAAAAQERLLDLASMDPELEKKRREIIGRVNDEQWMFEPNHLGFKINVYLNSLQPISGSTAFAKLRWHAGLPE